MNNNRTYLQVVNNQTSINIMHDKFEKAFKKYDYVNMNYFYQSKKNIKKINIHEQLNIKINPNLYIKRMRNKEKNLFQKFWPNYSFRRLTNKAKFQKEDEFKKNNKNWFDFYYNN